MGSELKYTDRDVRDNKAHVTELVTDFLESYTGEFQFLIDCKMRLAQGLELTVGMMRGVLNCMRADPRILVDMPDPLPIEEAKVIRLPRKWGPSDCYEPLDHGGHYIGEEKDFERRHWCSGRWSINRRGFVLPGTITGKYTAIVTRTGSLIHRLNGDAEVRWFPEAHSKGYWQDPEIIYLTCCKGCSRVRNGFLLTHHDVTNLLKDREPLNQAIYVRHGVLPPPSQNKPLSRCPRCWQ